MLRYFKRLETRALELGNHRRKYLHGIERWGRLLIDRLEESGSFDRVHLRRRATDVAFEMDSVIASGKTHEEKLGLLGCYYALQFLLLNIRSIDTLRINVAESENHVAVYREFLRRTGDDYWKLLREYIRRLLRVFLAKGPRPEFLLCAVGTRIHQDDVDLAILDDGNPHRAELDRAVARMATEMMRWSSSPDFYLSEHIGAAGYAVSIDEFAGRLDESLLDYVSVTEILAAQPLVGSGTIFERLQGTIQERYYYRRHGTNREHEGYLRGILSELNTLLWWPQNPNLVHPKHDLLRAVTGILAAHRVTYGIDESDPWKMLARIAGEVKNQRENVRKLERAYTFVEAFRHLYQQFGAQEEEIDLSLDVERHSLQQVAEAMGYADRGVVHAWHHLLVHYHEHVRVGRGIVEELTTNISQHVQRSTVFAPIVRRRLAARHHPERRENLAEAMLRARAHFGGIKYWQDLIEALAAPDGVLLEALVTDLNALPPERRLAAIKGYAAWGHDTFFTALSLLVLLRRAAPRLDTLAICETLNAAFLDGISGDPDEIRRFATVFVHNPALVHEWLSMIDDDSRRRFHALLAGPLHTPGQESWRDRLRALSYVHVAASRHFNRALSRVCAERPEHLLDLADLGKIESGAQGRLAEAMRAASPVSQKAALGTYYDLELVRAGIATLRGGNAQEIDARAALVCDLYLETLFDICKSEVDRQQGRRLLTHDRLGVFVCGGHARERAFQDDWDLFVLLLDDSDELLKYSNQIMARVNREIAARGLMPQYHFGDIFGTYVTSLPALERFLQEERVDKFVAMSQLVGSRLVVGSSRAEATFFERVIEGHVYRETPFFLRAASEEIRARRAFRSRKGHDDDVDIKECRGGLRDLELLMLIWKVRDHAREPIGERFWDLLMLRHPEHQDAFAELKRAYAFLNALRDAYRLTVAPVNRLDRAELLRPAAVLEPDADSDPDRAARIWRRFLDERALVARRVDEILVELAQDATGNSA